jgi:hypothetical protein
MPIAGMPDTTRHRICRRCQRWFEPHEGKLMTPELTGPVGASQSLRASLGDTSVLRFQCARCTKIRRVTQITLWSILAVIVAVILLLERIGVLS